VVWLLGVWGVCVGWVAVLELSWGLLRGWSSLSVYGEGRNWSLKRCMKMARGRFIHSDFCKEGWRVVYKLVPRGGGGGKGSCVTPRSKGVKKSEMRACERPALPGEVRGGGARGLSEEGGGRRDESLSRAEGAMRDVFGKEKIG